MLAIFRKLLLLALTLSTLLACRLPGMIPLTSQLNVDMETDADKVIEVLSSEDWVALQAVVNEEYGEDDYAKPGTLTFSADVTNEQPVYFSYGWCTVDEATLQQNFEHITVTLSLDGNELENNVVHPLTFTQAGSLVCLDFGVLFLNWEPGEYELKAVASFEEVINDGMADYDAGDYVFVYNVTVSE